MRILFVTTGLPYPPDSGKRINTYNIIKNLSKDNEISLFLIIHSDEEKKNLKNLEQFCRKIYLVYLNLPAITEKIRWQDIFRIFSRLPLSVKRRKSRKVKLGLIKVLKENNFNIVQFEQVALAEYGKSIKDIPTILATKDIVSYILKRQFENERNIIKKAILFFEYKKMLNYEKNTSRFFTKILAVSKQDKSFFINQGIPDKKIAIIPNGVDIDFYQLLDPTDGRNIIYTGDMHYYPNFDAVDNFCANIFPYVLKKVKAKFIIVGKSGIIKDKLNINNDVEFTGYVSDIRPFFQKAALLVVPIRIGSGTRIKILEAMAMGRPVVSTTIGCEGLEVTDGEDILIADKPEDFANCVSRLLEDKELWNKLSQNGRKLVEEKYSWEKITKRLEKVYEEII